MFNQGFGAYFTGLGDIDLAEGNIKMAKYHYDYALTQDPLSERERITQWLQSLGFREIRWHAYMYFKDARGKGNPKPYANMSQMKSLSNRIFPSCFRFAIWSGRQSGKWGTCIIIWLLLFNETNLGDSAYVYFELAKKYAKNPEIIESNMYSLWAKYPSIAENEGF